MNKHRKVILSLGSNIEDRYLYINNAIKAIEEVFHSEVKQSQLYETAPWGFDADVPFLNCCISFYSSCNPKEVLKATQLIEKNSGRVKKSQKMKYQSRVIDIDILFIGNLVVNTDDLQLPHPLLYDRSFVLTPLMELCPDFVDPVKKVSISQLVEQCNDENKVLLYKN